MTTIKTVKSGKHFYISHVHCSHNAIASLVFTGLYIVDYTWWLAVFKIIVLYVTKVLSIILITNQ